MSAISIRDFFLFVAVISIRNADALSRLKKTPKNVVVEKGTNVTLECASNNSSSILWTHAVSIVTSMPCTAHNPELYIAKPVDNYSCYLRLSAAAASMDPTHVTASAIFKRKQL